MIDVLAQYSFRVGDQVVIKGWPPSNVLEVIDINDPAMISLLIPGGTTLKVGRLAVVLMDSGSSVGQ